MFHPTTLNLDNNTVFYQQQYCIQPPMQYLPFDTAFHQQHCIQAAIQHSPNDTVFNHQYGIQQTQQVQDQRVAALEEQMASALLKCEQDKENIMKALKAERVCRRKAEADLKAAKRQPPKVVRLLTLSPAEEGQHRQNVPTHVEQQQLKEIGELTLHNAALKKEIGDKELRWSEEKERLMKALEAERAAWRNAEAVLKKQIAENAVREEAEKENILQALRKEREMREMERTANKVLNVRLENENTSLKLTVKAKDEAIDLAKSQFTAQTRQAADASDESRRTFLKINEELKSLLKKATQEMSELVSKTTTEKAVLEAKLQDTEKKVVQCEAECGNKVARCLAESDEKMKNMKVTNRLLQEQIIELWKTNKDLEECAQRTDKEKAKLKKNAEKVAKEAAEKERREEKENKKKAKEFLKTQKKEREAQLASDAKEQKRQDEERKLREK